MHKQTIFSLYPVFLMAAIRREFVLELLHLLVPILALPV
jgi:hypothetical protein